MTRMKNNRQVILQHLLLACVTLLILFLPLQSGMFFGSDGDWYSQHVGIGESLRQTMMETGSLIPQYIRLGGGSSIYDFSYYGLLRPDILISCLIPEVKMKYIIAGYMVLEVVASVQLMFMWLKRQGLKCRFAFAGALLFASATCFYHAHNQIMFVNYLPFLLLALMGLEYMIQGRGSWSLVLTLFFVYVHSYYYSISCLAVIFIYMVHQMLRHPEYRKWKMVGRFVYAVVISIGMAAVLLFPTGLDILSTKKDAGSFESFYVGLIDGSFKGLLYSPYGCGMTLLTLYCLILSVRKRGKRFLSVTLLLCVAMPVISLVLNGFLYARAKILIPFTVLYVYVAADCLQDLYQENQKYRILPYIFCLIPLCFSSWKIPLLIDAGILLVWLMLCGMKCIPQKVKNYVFWSILAVPILASLLVNASSSYLKPVCERMGIQAGNTYLMKEDNRQEHFTSEEIKGSVMDVRYRFDVLANNFVNCNVLADANINRTAMYSSVTNADYAAFYYDTMNNPISINNRVALLPSQNPIFCYLMGLKYILFRKDCVPYGYEIVMENSDYVLAKNEDVLPICYGTIELMSEETYQRLQFPGTLEALCSQSIVPVDEGTKFISHIQEENAEDFFIDEEVKRLLQPSGKKESYSLTLCKPLSKKVLILRFHVESDDGQAVIVSINGMKNKLSAKNAPYPNKNNDFTYILSSGECMKELQVELSEGEYEINRLKIYTIDEKVLGHSKVVLPEEYMRSKDYGRNVFAGKINMEQDGYFITSYPYRKGYQIAVDGIPVEPQKVNTAFIGFPITVGEHTVDIGFEAPGYQCGCVISIVCWILFAVILFMYLWR